MSTNEIGRRLKAARISAGLTQADAAAILGVSYQTISSYERGVNRIDSDALLKLCAAYGLTVSELMGEVAQKAPRADDLTPDERELIELYRRASSDDQELIRHILKKYENPAEQAPASAG